MCRSFSRLCIVFAALTVLWEIQPVQALHKAATLTPSSSSQRLKPVRCMVGKASWYGRFFHKKRTASGERFNMHAVSAAHPWWPLKTWVRVTNLVNNRSIVVQINDRLPSRSGRVLDLSKKAAEILGFVAAGITRVRVEAVSVPSINSRSHLAL